jgi:hypothetical protein
VLGNNDISPRFESSYLEEIQRVSNLVLLLLLLLFVPDFRILVPESIFWGRQVCKQSSFLFSEFGGECLSAWAHVS